MKITNVYLLQQHTFEYHHQVVGNLQFRTTSPLKPLTAKHHSNLRSFTIRSWTLLANYLLSPNYETYPQPCLTLITNFRSYKIDLLMEISRQIN